MRRGLYAIVLVILLVGARKVPPMWRHGRMLYFQWRCMRYVAPPDQAICDEPLPYAGTRPPFTSSAPDPPELAGAGFRAMVSTTAAGPTSGPVLFMHERTTSSGQRRLLILQRVPPGERVSWDIPIAFVAQIIEPATILHDASSSTMHYYEVIPMKFLNGPSRSGVGGSFASLQLFAGQPDPTDASHFTIAFDSADDMGTIDGWLVDRRPEDGDARRATEPTILLVLRTGDAPLPLR